MKKINPTIEQFETLVPSGQNLVYFEGRVIPLAEAKRSQIDPQYIDLCEESVTSAFDDLGGSLLLPPKGSKQDLRGYARDNGIRVSFVQTERPQTIGYVLLGSAELKIDSDDEVTTHAIMETTHRGLFADVAATVVDQAIEEFDINPEAVLHFTPKTPDIMKRRIHNPFSRKVETLEAQVDPIGANITAILSGEHAVTINRAFGLLEPLSNYRKRIG